MARDAATTKTTTTPDKRCVFSLARTLDALGLNPVFETIQFPTRVAGLHARLPNVNRDDFTHDDAVFVPSTRSPRSMMSVCISFAFTAPVRSSEMRSLRRARRIVPPIGHPSARSVHAFRLFIFGSQQRRRATSGETSTVGRRARLIFSHPSRRRARGDARGRRARDVGAFERVGRDSSRERDSRWRDDDDGSSS